MVWHTGAGGTASCSVPEASEQQLKVGGGGWRGAEPGVLRLPGPPPLAGEGPSEEAEEAAGCRPTRLLSALVLISLIFITRKQGQAGGREGDTPRFSWKDLNMECGGAPWMPGAWRRWAASPGRWCPAPASATGSRLPETPSSVLTSPRSAPLFWKGARRDSPPPTGQRGHCSGGCQGITLTGPSPGKEDRP